VSGWDAGARRGGGRCPARQGTRPARGGARGPPACPLSTLVRSSPASCSSACPGGARGWRRRAGGRGIRAGVRGGVLVAPGARRRGGVGGRGRRGAGAPAAAARPAVAGAGVAARASAPAACTVLAIHRLDRQDPRPRDILAALLAKAMADGRQPGEPQHGDRIAASRSSRHRASAPRALVVEMAMRGAGQIAEADGDRRA